MSLRIVHIKKPVDERVKALAETFVRNDLARQQKAIDKERKETTQKVQKHANAN